jgi:hypothetical protein
MREDKSVCINGTSWRKMAMENRRREASLLGNSQALLVTLHNTHRWTPHRKPRRMYSVELAKPTRRRSQSSYLPVPGCAWCECLESDSWQVVIRGNLRCAQFKSINTFRTDKTHQVIMVGKSATAVDEPPMETVVSDLAAAPSASAARRKGNRKYRGLTCANCRIRKVCVAPKLLIHRTSRPGTADRDLTSIL